MLLELQTYGNGLRCLIVRKSRSIPEEKKIFFKLVADGIIKSEEK
jgi:hypothetical protein